MVLLVHRAADAAGDAGDVGIEHAVVSDVHVHHAGPAHAVGGGMAEAVVWEAVVHRVRCVQLRKPVAVGRVLRHQAGRGWCHLCDGPNLPVPAPSLDALVAVLEDLGKVEHELLLFLGNRVVVDGGELLREFREGFEMELVEVALSGALVVEFIQLLERVSYLEVATLRKGFVAVVQLAYEGLDLVVRPGVGLEVTALRKRPATLVTVEGLLARMPAHMCLLSAVRRSPDGSRRERHWGHIPSSFHVGKMPARIRGFCRPTQRPVSGSPGEGEDASSHMASLQCEHVDASRDASFGKRSWSTPRWRTCIACASGTFHQHAARRKRCDGPGTRHRCPGLVSVRLFELGGWPLRTCSVLISRSDTALKSLSTLLTTVSGSTWAWMAFIRVSTPVLKSTLISSLTGMLVVMTLGLVRDEVGKDFRVGAVDTEDMCDSLLADGLLLRCIDDEQSLTE